MISDRRNPYLVLGVPYGTSRAEATRAFAQRSRRARREATFPYTVDDMTWALHQIEAHLDNPSAAIDHFRVPADPSTLQVPPGPGLLRPPATPLERRTQPADSAERQSLRDQARKDVTDALLERAATNAIASHLTDGLSAPLQVRLRTPPQRKRARWPWLVLLAAVLAIAGVIAAVLYNAQHSDSRSSGPPSRTVAPTTTTTSTAAPSNTNLIAADLQSLLTVFDRTETAGLAYLAARDSAEAQFAAAWDGTGTSAEFDDAAAPWVLRLAEAATSLESTIEPLVNELAALTLRTTEVDEIRDLAMNHYFAWRAYAPALAGAADEWVHGSINDFNAVADDFDITKLEDDTVNTWTKLCDQLMAVAPAAGDGFRQTAAAHCET